MTIDYSHGKSIEGHVQYAPHKGAAGYLPIEDVMPSYQEGKIAVVDHWEERDGKCVCVYAIIDAPKEYRKFSKLKIYGAIISLPDSNGTSAWDKVKAWLEAKTIGGVNGWMAFQLAQEISEDHPLFAVLADEARQLLGLTQEQFDALLDQCILEG